MVSIATKNGSNFHLGSIIKKRKEKIIDREVYILVCEEGEIVLNSADMKKAMARPKTIRRK